MGGLDRAVVKAFRLWRASEGVREETGGLPIVTNWSKNILACGSSGIISSLNL
jgi:hypothetical protein